MITLTDPSLVDALNLLVTIMIVLCTIVVAIIWPTEGKRPSDPYDFSSTTTESVPNKSKEVLQ